MPTSQENQREFLHMETKHTNSVAFNPQTNYRSSVCHMSTKLVSTFSRRECRMVSATDPQGR
jgi:hypothetical protein